MEDIRLNVDDALANIEMEVPIINYLRTASKSQCTMTRTQKQKKLKATLKRNMMKQL